MGGRRPACPARSAFSPGPHPDLLALQPYASLPGVSAGLTVHPNRQSACRDSSTALPRVRRSAVCGPYAARVPDPLKACGPLNAVRIGASRPRPVEGSSTHSARAPRPVVLAEISTIDRTRALSHRMRGGSGLLCYRFAMVALLVQSGCGADSGPGPASGPKLRLETRREASPEGIAPRSQGGSSLRPAADRLTASLPLRPLRLSRSCHPWNFESRPARGPADSTGKRSAR